jgi:hypothetical protein
MVNVNYRAEAGLYHRVFGGFKISGPLGYKRFRTAAGAIRFAIERLPAKFLLGASLEVGDERYNEKEIRQLYDSEAYPLKRHGKRLSLQKAPSKISRG